MVEIISKFIPGQREKPVDTSLYSKPLFVSQERANRYATAARFAGAKMYYLTEEGEEIKRKQWERALQYDGMGYVQLQYTNKAMWQEFVKEEMRLAEIDAEKAMEVQARQYGVQRGTSISGSAEKRNGTIFSFGKTLGDRRNPRKAA